jgi:anaphase-promoting complex subunit 4
VRLVGAESSKTVHQFNTSTETAGITCMAWACNRTSRNSELQGSKNALGSWEALLPADIISDGKGALDLPRDLALIDIEPSLPKLSVLAAGGGS